MVTCKCSEVRTVLSWLIPNHDYVFDNGCRTLPKFSYCSIELIILCKCSQPLCKNLSCFDLCFLGGKSRDCSGFCYFLNDLPLQAANLHLPSTPWLSFCLLAMQTILAYIKIQSSHILVICFLSLPLKFCTIWHDIKI